MKEILTAVAAFVIIILSWVAFFRVGYYSGLIQGFDSGMEEQRRITKAVYGDASAHLLWLEQRCINLYGESENVDFLRRLHNIATQFQTLETT
jgi:hypothetical protein